jgi:hypothetical protein
VTTTEQGTERPITGRPAGAVAAALVVVLAVRDTFWMGVGMLAGAVIVAAAGLVAFMMLADAFA